MYFINDNKTKQNKILSVYYSVPTIQNLYYNLTKFSYLKLTQSFNSAYPHHHSPTNTTTNP